jgi:putative phosphoribosyl transferase
MLFDDRKDAARRLAARLATWRGQRPLVLAIPRGAVPMARTLAGLLDGEYDVVLVRKLRAPHQPELTIGAISEGGWRSIAPYAAEVGADDAYIAQEEHRQRQLLAERRQRYAPLRPPVDPAGRVVIVIDDGLATGATMAAALHSVRERRPARLICAVPVASPEALDTVRPLADEVVCLHAPPDFRAVGQFYRDFSEVDDETVAALLAVPSPAGGASATH